MPTSSRGRRQRGGTLGKVLLLIFFLCLIVAFWVIKGKYGVTGEVRPLDFSTKDHVVFLRQDTNGQTNVFTVKLDGTGERKLTDDPSPKQGVSWSPDGKQLCYAAEMKDANVPAYQLLLFDSRGSTQITFGSGSKQSPEWRPDGKQIAFLMGGVLKVVLPNGEGMEQVYPHFHKGGGEEDDDQESGQRKPPLMFYRWSPDGTALAAVQVAEGEQAIVQGRSDWFKNREPQDSQPAIVAEPETMLILPAGGEEPTVRPETNSSKVGFSWFPDSKQIAVTMSTRSKQHGIAVLRADDQRLPAVALFASGNYTVAAENPSVSPDGKNVAFEAWRIDSAENRELLGIAVISADIKPALIIKTASDLAKLPLVVKGHTTNPGWSIDSSRIIYQLTTPKGLRDLWSARSDGSNQINLTKGKGDNFDASCSPAK
jgi:Tol biopolymer transport system component